MAKYNSLKDLFTATADAIRAKTGGTDTIVAEDFPEVIEGMSTGGGSPSYAYGSITTDSGDFTWNVIEHNLGRPPQLIYIRQSTIPTTTRERDLLFGVMAIDLSQCTTTKYHRSISYAYTNDKSATPAISMSTNKNGDGNVFGDSELVKGYNNDTFMGMLVNAKYLGFESTITNGTYGFFRPNTTYEWWVM